MAKFLIVDDSPIERFALRKCVEKLQHEVVGEAKNGEESLELYKKLNPDVVILDVVMHNEDGIKILAELLNNDSSAKIIMCTSEATESTVIKASKLGAKYFLAKPVTMYAFSKTVEKILL